ncbi:DegV family protein [Desulforamulus aeronauticus]|uniref:EDD domain protein, DegV family n=1 Tax=Desulforamulus aeronauticus DSM 10349 TaxID=1121421 RepID=A0A1M6VVC4_9FIRM|nr:DegV family protein [Desulforamulus aeronauticus]SHK85276.1 EDD domain protein, DegV family [Desulforamulus aeronauticus DSM 10349]
MPPVRIVTDSTADLPEHLYQRFGISRVPLKVFIGSEMYRDGIEITPDEFYQQLSQGKLASTSQPAPGEFASKFEELMKDGSKILCLTLSSQFSGTCQSARLAANMVKHKGQVEVIDTRSATWGVGLMAIAASQALAVGKSYDEVKALVTNLIPKMKISFLVDSLDYLERGGRIGKAQAFLGSLLNIKPLLAVKEGIVYPSQKIRGKNKGLERMVEMVEQDSGDSPIICAVLGGGDPEARDILQQKVKARLNCQELWLGDVGPVIGSHVGPGVSGIIYYCL